MEGSSRPGGTGTPTRAPRLRLAGALAAVGVVLAVALVALVRSPAPPRAPETPALAHVGSARCAACHPGEHAAWKGSHHALAMQPAREGTVLGDFADARLVHRGREWRFSRRGDEFVVHAEGPDGEMHDYPVAFTFGVEPLQQYLVRFPGGRLQVLSSAWDTRARRWFHVDPRGAAAPGDWLHWTRPGQGWNGMCADCHSTAVRKGYDPDTDTYETTSSEVSVGCEACHGAGSRHVAWAEQPAAGRPAVENAALPTRTSSLAAPGLVSLCAPCHARRAQFRDQGTPGGALLDRYLPSTLSPGVFHPDGQIQDEDFEWHAFTQSKMYARGVRCTDCHDPHSGRRREEGNALCTRCHEAGAFDAPSHHHHAAEWRGRPNPGALCVSCHMPGQDFMVVHFRRDHSMRVPRPDLTASVGVPNACGASGCHADRPLSWIRARYDGWWGKERVPHPGTAIAAGRRRDPGAEAGLAALAGDPLHPAVMRATAVELLAAYRGPAPIAAMERALQDSDPLVRATAVQRIPLADPSALARTIGPLLSDPVRAVRMNAAARLAGDAATRLPESDRKAQAAALGEYEEAQRYMSDLPSGPFNLGNLYVALGRTADAERAYRRALAIDPALVPASVNLALLLSGTGRAEEAERLLREAHARQPDAAEIPLDLGLLLAERGDRAGAEAMLRDALRADPRLAQAAYNLAVLVGERDPAQGIAFARRAATLAPDEPRHAFTLGWLQARSGDLRGAVATLEALLASHPGNPDAVALLAQVRARMGVQSPRPRP